MKNEATETEGTKTELAGTCGVCLRAHQMMRTRDDKLVLAHHGYTRPGGGYQTSSCFSARMDAWEISSKPVELLIVRLKELLAWNEKILSDYVTGKITTISIRVEKSPRVVDHTYRDGYRMVTVWQKETIEFHPGDAPRSVRCDDGAMRSVSWNSLLRGKITKHEDTIEQLRSDINTFEKRVAGWKPGALFDSTEAPRFVRAPGAQPFQVTEFIPRANAYGQRYTSYEIWTGFKWDRLRADDWYKLSKAGDAEIWNKDRSKLLLPSGAAAPEKVRGLTMTQEKILRQLARAEGGSLRRIDGAPKAEEMDLVVKCSKKSVAALAALGVVTVSSVTASYEYEVVTITDLGRVSIG